MGRTKQISEEDQTWVSEILEEASRWGLRWEVETWAQKFLNENPEMDLVTAYDNAFNEWIK